MKLTATLLLSSLCAVALCQAGAPTQSKDSGQKDQAKQQTKSPTPEEIEKMLEQESKEKRDAIVKAEKDGIEVRIKGIAHARGIRSNQLMGTGLVVGLSGTGDSKKAIITQQIVSNMFKEFGIKLDPTQLDLKNIAAVMVTADLPAFSSNGDTIDVQVQSIGDAKSLAGGTLLQTALYAAGDTETPYVFAQGSLSLGGFDVSAGGSSSKKNFVTAGRVPDGGIVERGAPTKLVYDGKVYLDLDEADLTTAERIAAKINQSYPAFGALAESGGTVALTLPEGMSAIDMMSKVEALTVYADTPETIVINEKTGTIVIGGNVKIGPAAIVHGDLSVKIDQDIRVSQPSPFSLGTTAMTQKTKIDVSEPKADVASLAPNTTVADLARVFHALQLKASDVIAILQALKEQGALKARILSQ